MKKWLLGVLFIFMVGVVAGGCGKQVEQAGQNTGSQKEITVSAAISLKDALAKIKEDYAKEHPEVKITYNLGASGSLQKQIEQGAPVDLFISAGVGQMDQLEEKGLLEPDSRTNLLSNELVVVVPKNAAPLKDFNDLAGSGVKRIALGMPDTVPAGQYTRESLTNLKLWDKLQPRLVMANDVRQVLTYVETGNADAGFVYRSDALMGKNVRVDLTVPDNLHKPIVYPAAVLKNAPQKEAAREFLRYLASPAGMKVFAEFGLKPGQKQGV
ncbi:molybdate ABC transporter substrate-binding protein [Desulfofundulus thermobenzoicus]|uniref:Molybdate ABC transporter substrate-binding protein n=1 Tax=Desulfofundulus thermobenzoicus TaxID=29376 RepID=A0A6N7ILC5_9FIRM|nr:molybdate ABC transporter substrate-binding protein [Desulfofundulus thermobenzoicus]MQL50780.1 molybdate ABC transporter substrate-binding protein [Desulfofundulus thermobenzoicus]HHW43114.1 molybdate ABC transporter substrate-binding protein [Desulfotomaculum sp.]